MDSFAEVRERIQRSLAMTSDCHRVTLSYPFPSFINSPKSTHVPSITCKSDGSKWVIGKRASALSHVLPSVTPTPSRACSPHSNGTVLPTTTSFFFHAALGYQNKTVIGKFKSVMGLPCSSATNGNK